MPVAYAHGKPVVVTRTGGLPDIVEHGVTGLLVPPCDEGALADAVVQLLSDPEASRRMGQAGRNKLEAECSEPVIAEQTAQVYHRAIQSRNAGPLGRGPNVHRSRSWEDSGGTRQARG